MNVNRKTLRIVGTAWVAVFALSLLASSPALAQGGGVLDPTNMQQQAAQAQRVDAAPQPTIDKSYPAWVGYAVMLLMAIGILPLALMPSKRSHQD